jgi:hypothetical protein
VIIGVTDGFLLLILLALLAIIAILVLSRGRL